MGWLRKSLINQAGIKTKSPGSVTINRVYEANGKEK